MFQNKLQINYKKTIFGTLNVLCRGMKRILIIEDNQDMNLIISNMLKRKGHLVDSVETGLAGIIMIRRVDYDVIITDFRLPDINGLDLIEKTVASSIQAKKIMISAHGNENVQRRLRDLNIDYLDKPFKNEDLYMKINSS